MQKDIVLKKELEVLQLDSQAEENNYDSFGFRH